METGLFSDEYFMKVALQEAELAFEKGEVPVGAVVVWNNQVIAKAHNLTETLTDVTAHAEMQAFTAAANALGGKYLHDCKLYVTLEPCVMCAGAAYWSQVSKVIYGAYDAERGYSRVRYNLLHPKTEVHGGIMESESAELLKKFFKTKR
jgi:tRNA(adenine34) deaminase